MSTITTSAHQNKSSEPSLKKDSSLFQKRESSAQRSTFNPMSPMKTSSPLPSLKKSWEQSYSSFQTSARSQCPRIHYHPWCDDCQTLTGWEQPPPIKQMYTPSRLTFGDLKMAIKEKSCYQFLFRNPSVSQEAVKRYARRGGKSSLQEQSPREAPRWQHGKHCANQHTGNVQPVELHHQSYERRGSLPS